MVSSTLRPHFTPGKDLVPILQEAGWAPGPVWTGGKSRPHRDSISDRLARSSVAIPTELPGPQFKYYNIMGPPSYMRSVVDRNVVMRRMTATDAKFQALKLVRSIIVDVIPYGVVHRSFSPRLLSHCHEHSQNGEQADISNLHLPARM